MSVAAPSPWAQAALEAETIAVAETPRGGRNAALNAAAFNLGQLVAGGALDRREVEEALRGAARACGLEHAETERTLASGLEAGAMHPRSGPGDRQAGEAVAGDGRPETVVRPGELPMLADACEQVLLSSTLPIYQRGGQLVRVAQLPEPSTEGGVRREAGSLILTPVTATWVCDALGRLVRFVKPRKGSGTVVPCDAPLPAAQALLARSGEWRFPVIRGLLAGPALRADGTVMNTTGYDSSTGYYQGAAMPDLEMKPQPGQEGALESLACLRGLLSEFPFIELLDEAVALALLLTSACRPAVARAPVFAVTSPVRGSGKSLLIDLAAMLSTGRPAAVLAAGGGGEELDKRIGASLLAGDELISLDSMNGVVRSDLLCQATTQERVRLRVMGSHEQRELACTAIWCATGNNLAIAGDLTRRAVLVRLDPRCERPELKRFRADPVAMLRRERAKYLGAALTIMRAYCLAGRPEVSELPPLGSFGAWSGLVRGALVWLGLPDPVLSMQELQTADPDAELLADLLRYWHAGLGESAYTLREVLQYAMADTTGGLRETLEDIAGGVVRSDINPRRLASWLRGQRGRVLDGRRIECSPQARGGVLRWQVVSV